MATILSLFGPALQICLLVSHAVCIYLGMTPPTPTPRTKELDRFAVSDLMTRTTRFQMAATAASKYLLCGVAVAEAAAILAQQIPSVFPERMLAILLPVGAAPHAAQPSLRGVPLAGCALGIVGGLIRVWCHRTLGRFFTWQMAVRDGHQLVTHGPYAIVRHPSYTGWILMISGSFMVLLGPGAYFVESGLWDTVVGRVAAVASVAYCTFSTVNLVRRAGKEDNVLRGVFKGRWDEWAQQTPYRLIPYIY